MRLSCLSAFLIAVFVPSYVAAQTPVRLPNIDPFAYLPARRPGPTVRISLASVSLTGSEAGAAQQRLRTVRQTAAEAKDLGLLINAANKELTDLGGGTISIEGGGSIKTQVQLDHHTKFDSSTYACDVQGITDFGCFLIGDNVLRSEEHTSELQSPCNLVCRLLLEKKNYPKLSSCLIHLTSSRSTAST